MVGATSGDSSDFYPRPPRGGRRDPALAHSQLHPISIHALREEGDMRFVVTGTVCPVFLSTPSARRATRALLGDRQAQEISIHALREEGDLS